MTKTIKRELRFPQSRDLVWRALANSDSLAEWMYPNDFEPRVGHQFTFIVPPKPAVGFEGLVVRCEVLECDPPEALAFSWSAGGPVENTRVSYRLEPEGQGTRVLFEHSGFDLTQIRGQQALQGAEMGWAGMFKKFLVVVDEFAAREG